FWLSATAEPPGPRNCGQASGSPACPFDVKRPNAATAMNRFMSVTPLDVNAGQERGMPAFARSRSPSLAFHLDLGEGNGERRVRSWILLKPQSSTWRSLFAAHVEFFVNWERGIFEFHVMEMSCTNPPRERGILLAAPRLRVELVQQQTKSGQRC